MSNTMPTVTGTDDDDDGRTLCVAELSLVGTFYGRDFIFFAMRFRRFRRVIVNAGWTWCVCVCVRWMGVGGGVVRNNLATLSRRRGGGGNNVVRGCWPKSAHSVYGVFTTPPSILTTVYAETVYGELYSRFWRGGSGGRRRLTPDIRRRFRRGAALQVVHSITWTENNVSDDRSDFNGCGPKFRSSPTPSHQSIGV